MAEVYTPVVIIYGDSVNYKYDEGDVIEYISPAGFKSNHTGIIKVATRDHCYVLWDFGGDPIRHDYDYLNGDYIKLVRKAKSISLEEARKEVI